MSGIDAIKARTSINAATGGWLWKGGKTGNGYGVSRATVYGIAACRSWRHIPR